MHDGELVTHEQVTRWLASDVRFAIDPHEHQWIAIRDLADAHDRLICTVTGCDAETAEAAEADLDEAAYAARDEQDRADAFHDDGLGDR